MNEQILVIWRGLMEMGTQHLAKQLYQEAERFFDQSAALAQQLQVPEIKAFTIRLLATSRVKLGQLDLAENGFREALGICEEIQNGKGMSEAWAGLASVAVAKGSLTDAQQGYERSIAIYPKSSPPLRLGMLYSDLGQVYAALKNWPKAERAYIRAKELCQRYGYPKGEGELNVLLGEIYYRQGRKKSALFWVGEACKQFARIGENAAMASSLQYQAFLHYDMGDMSDAAISQGRAVILWMELGEITEITEGCYFLSKILQNLGEIEEAENYLTISIVNYQKQDIGLALRYQSLAGLAVLRHDLTKAEEHYRKALKLFETLDDQSKVSEIFESLAYVAEATGREHEALYFHERSCLTMGSELRSSGAVQKLGRFYENAHAYFEALHTYWQAMKFAKDLGENVEEIERSIQRVSRRIRQKH